MFSNAVIASGLPNGGVNALRLNGKIRSSWRGGLCVVHGYSVKVHPSSPLGG